MELWPMPITIGHAPSRPSFVTSASMRRVALFDIDSRIPNLALMKLSAYCKTQGCEVVLARKPIRIETDKYFASTVFFRASSRERIDALQALYGDRIEIGGSGIHLGKRHPAEAEASFPDYGLYGHRSYALGFLTRGCRRRCAFCIVPEKEGAVKQPAGSFDDFVPSGQKNVMLLDDNLLSFNGGESTSVCNYPGTISHFMARRHVEELRPRRRLGCLHLRFRHALERGLCTMDDAAPPSIDPLEKSNLPDARPVSQL